MVLFLLFSFLPDMDKIGSKISQKFRVVSILIKFFIAHRGLLHSIWMPLTLYLLLFLIKMDVAIAISFGYLSHILLDALTVQGIKPLWPLKKRLRGFVRSGGLIENIILIVLLVVDVYFLVRF
jgi:inner membrane protein